MAPWIFLLFAMVFDLGFYSYAVIATQNAARSAAMFTSKSEDVARVNQSAKACLIAVQELQGMPNVSSATTCAASKGAITTGTPIYVNPVVTYAGPDGRNAIRVEVTYRSPNFFLLPGLTNLLTVTRISEARIREN